MAVDRWMCCCNNDSVDTYHAFPVCSTLRLDIIHAPQFLTNAFDFVPTMTESTLHSLLSFQFTFSLHSVTDIALKHGEQFGTTFSILLTDTVRQTILMLNTQKLLKWDQVSDWSLMLFHSVLSRPSYDPRLASTPNLRSSILFNLLTGNC